MMFVVLFLHLRGQIFLKVIRDALRNLLRRVYDCLESYLDDGSYSNTDYQEFLIGDGKYPAITICLEVIFYSGSLHI